MELSIVAQLPLRILLVEDDPIVQKIHKAFLSKMGYAVDSAINGEQAIALYSPEYDLILLDANLPDLDGFAVAEYIRKQEMQTHCSPKPIILLSAYPIEYVAQACLQAKINAFFNKPISYESLKMIIDQYLQKNLPAITFKHTIRIHQS